MEKPSLVKTPSEIFKGVVLPETGVALEKIPPIADKVDLLPVIPKSSLIKQKAKVDFFNCVNVQCTYILQSKHTRHKL